jgi:hypothetical protein
MDVRVNPNKTNWARKANSSVTEPHVEGLESFDALRLEKEVQAKLQMNLKRGLSLKDPCIFNMSY